MEKTVKKLLSLLLLIAFTSAHGMQNQEQIKLEDRLLVGIRDNNLLQVKSAIEAGAPLHEIKYLVGYKGEEPLRSAYGQGKLLIAEYLLSRGANKAILNEFLKDAAANGEVEKVSWLLSHGAQDVDGHALKEATDTYKHYSEEKYDNRATIRYGKIKELLTEAKRKSTWKSKLASPSKGIFLELESEEFLNSGKTAK